MSRQKPKKQSGIQLPFALQKELGLQDGGADKGRKRQKGGSIVSNRKERRKSERDEKKRGGRHLGTNTSNQTIRPKDSFHESGNEGNVIFKPKAKPPTVKPLTKSMNIAIPLKPKSILKKTKARSPSHEMSESESSRASSPGLVLDPNSRSFRQRAEEDDAEIAALERKLGVKSVDGSKLEDDLLDFVLEGSEEQENKGSKRKKEGQDWLDKKRRKIAAKEIEEVDSNISGSDLEGLEGFDDQDLLSEDEGEGFLAANGVNEDIEDGLDGLDNDSFDERNVGGERYNGFQTDEEAAQEPITVRKIRENPYIAPVAPGSTAVKYVPPSLRKREESDSSGLETLTRQLQGHLNKLSEANIISILGEIEKLYRTNPRQDVTTVLIDLILVSFCVRSALQNTFIILHASFLAAVYKVMGTDFGAELVVRVVERFDHGYRSGDAGKEPLNLISLLANLFTFNVVSSNIIYDHIRLLLSDFSEANAELLLRVVRDCGPQLRSDDSSALKDIVQMMQDTSADLAKNGQPINIRTTVMMDTITDLKNNKIKNATNAAGLTGEHITRMRKALGSLNNRTLKATEPLRITRSDIENSDKKGKWWLVGASWKGNQQKDKQNHEPRDDNLTSGYDTVQNEEEVDLLALARQYRMNTDVRRSIFVAIMSANDCRDAQTRLLKLRLSTKQEQEIAKVLLRCARAEPAYNPYYALLAKNLCKDNKKVRIGFQFGLWDFFGRMGEKADDDESDGEGDSATVEMYEIVNIAKMYSYLIFHGHLTVGVLKTLNIGFLKEQATMFLEVLLISIMTQPKAGEDELMKVFTRATETPQIVKALQYFIRKNVRKSDLVSKKDREKVKEGCRIAELTFRMIGSVDAS